MEVNGQIDGELHCTSLVIARGAHVTGTVAAERVVVVVGSSAGTSAANPISRSARTGFGPRKGWDCLMRRRFLRHTIACCIGNSSVRYGAARRSPKTSLSQSPPPGDQGIGRNA